MLTVIETEKFQKLAATLWSEDERMAFIDWIAANPLAGDVIPGARGARKVRWQVGGRGKRGGVRVVGRSAGAASAGVFAWCIFTCRPMGLFCWCWSTPRRSGRTSSPKTY